MLRRWSDCRAQARIRELNLELSETQSALEAANRTIAVQATEINVLASVIVRNHERVLAESAIESRRRADAEGPAHAQRT